MRPRPDKLIEAPVTRREWLRQRLFSPKIVATVVLAGLVVLVIPAIPGLWSSVEDDPRFRLTEDRIELTEPPNSVPRKIVEQTWDRHPEWAQRNLLEWTLARDLSQGFSEHPWIASVDRVEKSRTGRIIVTVQYRLPVAVIETHRGQFPIDATGVLLPSSDFSIADASPLPRVRGIRSMPNGQPGSAWGDPAVEAAAKVCTVLTPNQDLNRYWKRYQLAAIVAVKPSDEAPQPRGADQTFELLTLGGSPIFWGHAPGSDPLEPTAKQKLLRLDHYLSQYKSFDDPQVLRIDLTPLEGTARQIRTTAGERPSQPTNRSSQSAPDRIR